MSCALKGRKKVPAPTPVSAAPSGRVAIFASLPQGGAALALGYSPLPRWGKRAAKSEAARQTLQNAVTATDQQIDALVYDLYGLTKDEIKLVEGTP